MNASPWRVIRAIVGLAVLGFGIYTLTQSWEAARERLLPQPLVFLAAVLLAMMGAWAGARSWAVLLGESGSGGRLLRVFLAVQLSKYLPFGMAAHALSLVSLSVGGARSRQHVLGGYFLHLGVLLAAAFAMSAACVGPLTRTSPVLAALVLMLSVAGLLVLSPFARAILKLSGWLLPSAASTVGYTQKDLRRSMLRALITQLAAGVTFNLILAGGIEWSELHVGVGAFSLAWAAGFLALPFPAGIGVREAVLAFLMPGHGLAEIVAASFAHRLVIIVAEVVLSAVTLRVVGEGPSDKIGA